MRLDAWLRASAAAVLAIVLLGQGAAHAARPFLLTGSIDAIDEGDVDAGGRSGRFVVKDRHIGGRLSGTVGDALLTDVPFRFTFHTNVAIATQAGALHGILEFGGFQARVNAKSRLGLTPIPCDPATTQGCVPAPGGGGLVPGLLLDGRLTFLEGGGAGHGTVEGFVVPILDPEGHIVAAFGQVALSSGANGF
jgi:hypothetical protein